MSGWVVGVAGERWLPDLVCRPERITANENEDQTGKVTHGAIHRVIGIREHEEVMRREAQWLWAAFGRLQIVTCCFCVPA